MFKKIIKTKTNTAPAGAYNQLDKNDADQAGQLRRQNELDKKLVYSLNKAKIPRFRQIKYLFRVLNRRERLIFLALAALAVVGIIFIILNFYFSNFLPTPIVGGEYTEGLIGAPQYVNPILSQTNDVDSDLSRLIFSGLLKYDTNLQLAPDLAESYTASDDKKIYTFVLRDNLKWDDDQPLTANDVVFTFQSIQDKDFKSPLLISLRGVAVSKIDDRTIQFVLPDAYPAFLEVMTSGILPEHIWGEIPPINANLSEYNIKPVGCGPWKFQTLIKDSLGNVKSFTIKPNPNYFGQKPYLQKITFKFYADFESAISAIKNNSIDGISYLPRDYKSDLKGQTNLKYYSFDLPQYTAVFFNQKQNEALKDKNVRKALALGIDKNKILTEALQLEGKIIDGPLLPVAIDLPNDNILNYDVAAANQLLEDSGWEQISIADYKDFLAAETAAAQEEKTDVQTATSTPEEVIETPTVATSTQPFYRNKKNTILSLTLTTVDQPENVKAAELIKNFWGNIGVKVDLQIVQSSQISRDVIKSRNYQALLFGIIVGASADPYPFWHSSQAADPGLNLTMLASRTVDKLLEDARNAADAEKQQEDYQDFAETIATEIPAVFLYNPTYTYVVDKKIKGINTTRITVPADRFNNLPNWYINTKRVWHGR